MPGVIWGSPEEKSREWAYAKEKLTLDGKLLPDGTKLRRKDPDTDLKHSFMVMDGRIVALSGEGVHLGTGEFGHAKLAEDLEGNLIALKVIKEDNSDDGTAEVAMVEAQIANDLGIAGQCVTRSTAEGASKHYIAYQYLGLPLSEYLRANQALTLDQRYALCVKASLVLHEFHTRKQMKSKNSYTHNDIHLSNIVIDDQGELHLIDFEKAIEVSGDKDEFTCDIIKLLLLFRDPGYDSILGNRMPVYEFLYSPPQPSLELTNHEIEFNQRFIYVYLNPNDKEPQGAYSIIHYALLDPHGTVQKGTLSLSDIGVTPIKPKLEMLSQIDLRESKKRRIEDAIVSKTNSQGFTLLSNVLKSPRSLSYGSPTVPTALDIAEIVTLYRLQLGAFHGELTIRAQDARLQVIYILNSISAQLFFLYEKLNSLPNKDAALVHCIKKHILSHLEASLSEQKEDPVALLDIQFAMLHENNAQLLRQLITEIIHAIHYAKASGLAKINIPVLHDELSPLYQATSPEILETKSSDTKILAAKPQTEQKQISLGLEAMPTPEIKPKRSCTAIFWAFMAHPAVTAVGVLILLAGTAALIAASYGAAGVVIASALTVGGSVAVATGGVSTLLSILGICKSKGCMSKGTPSVLERESPVF